MQSLSRSFSSCGTASPTLMLLLLLPFCLFALEKVPFDIVEAESELIDGLTTEFDGFVFSLVYAAEVVTGFLTVKLFLTFCSGFLVVGYGILVISLFYGRSFLARILMQDLYEFVLTCGLFLSLVFLTVVSHPLTWYCPDSLHAMRW